MNTFLQKVFGVNWTTNIPATGFSACATLETFDLLPESYKKYALAFCAFMIAAGLFAAKSANVSNSSHPSDAKIIS